MRNLTRRRKVMPDKADGSRSPRRKKVEPVVPIARLIDVCENRQQTLDVFGICIRSVGVDSPLIDVTLDAMMGKLESNEIPNLMRKAVNEGVSGYRFVDALRRHFPRESDFPVAFAKCLRVLDADEFGILEHCLDHAIETWPEMAGSIIGNVRLHGLDLDAEYSATLIEKAKGFEFAAACAIYESLVGNDKAQEDVWACLTDGTRVQITKALQAKVSQTLDKGTATLINMILA